MHHAARPGLWRDLGCCLSSWTPPLCRDDGVAGGVMCMVDMYANSAVWAIAGGVWMRCIRDECLLCVRWVVL